MRAELADKVSQQQLNEMMEKIGESLGITNLTGKTGKRYVLD